MTILETRVLMFGVGVNVRKAQDACARCVPAVVKRVVPSDLIGGQVASLRLRPFSSSWLAHPESQTTTVNCKLNTLKWCLPREHCCCWRRKGRTGTARTGRTDGHNASVTLVEAALTSLVLVAQGLISFTERSLCHKTHQLLKTPATQ